MIDPLIVESLKKSTVILDYSVTLSLYSGISLYKGSGTGFIIDKKLGLIATNKHVASKEFIQEISVKFSTGRRLEAQLLYDDPRNDIAILKLKFFNRSFTLKEAKLQAQIPKSGERVFIIGNNGQIEFSFQEGTVVNNQTIGLFGIHSLIVSLNTKPGSSGSPISNMKGEVIGMMFAGNNIGAAIIPATYINNILKPLKNNLMPRRRDIGAIFHLCNLYDLLKYAHFPSYMLEKYIDENPHSGSRVVCINRIISNTPAFTFLNISDVLLKVNDIQVDSELYKLFSLISDSKYLILEIFRLGRLLTFNISTYDLHEVDVKQLIGIDNAVFYEADEKTYLNTGVNVKAVFVSNIPTHSSLNELSNSQILKVDIFEITTLNDLIKALPQILKLKHFTVLKKDYPNFNTNNKESLITGVNAKFVSLNTNEAYVFEYNPILSEWNKIVINSDDKYLRDACIEHSINIADLDNYSENYL